MKFNSNPLFISILLSYSQIINAAAADNKSSWNIFIFDKDKKEISSFINNEVNQEERSSEGEDSFAVDKVFEKNSVDIRELPKLFNDNEHQSKKELLFNGGRGPGGGDSYFCRKGENDFEGWYSYDFIQTRRDLKDLYSDIYEFTGSRCEDYLEQIHHRLEKSNSLMALGLREYISSLPPPFSRSESMSSPIQRTWRPIHSEGPSDFCLVYDLKDETPNISPSNCVPCQLFLRKYSETKSQLYYFYDEENLAHIKKVPLQCSYAVVHEWARDFLPHSQDLYDFVDYLHSKNFFNPLNTFKYNYLFESRGQNILQQNDTIELYYDLVTQVPATPIEVKEMKEQFINKFYARVAEVKKDIQRLKNSLKKDKTLPRQLDVVAEQWLSSIVDRYEKKKIPLGPALFELEELDQSLPVMRVRPFMNPIEESLLFNRVRGPSPVDFSKFHKEPSQVKEGSSFVDHDE